MSRIQENHSIFIKTVLMNDRPNDLLRIRPAIKKTQTFESMGEEERFQNETLRPILKLQNPLLIAVFHHYIEKRKGVFYNFNLDQKLTYMQNSILQDQKFRNSMIGLVIGHFTLGEYSVYKQYSSSLNKRVINLNLERLKDQIHLFEAPQ